MLVKEPKQAGSDTNQAQGQHGNGKIGPPPKPADSSPLAVGFGLRRFAHDERRQPKLSRDFKILNQGIDVGIETVTLRAEAARQHNRQAETAADSGDFQENASNTASEQTRS